jgi:PilZ domain
MNRFIERFEHDRRLVRRHNLKTPLRVHVWKSLAPEENLESENLSENGVCFATDSAMSKGDTLQMFFSMPEEVTGMPSTEWHCTGHVVRANPQQGKMCVGVQFDFYEISRSEGPQQTTRAARYGDVQLDLATLKPIARSRN